MRGFGGVDNELEQSAAAHANIFDDEDCIQKRRKAIVKSTLNRSTKGSSASSAMQGKAWGLKIVDDHKIFINYSLLCDDIYVCDWM